MSKEKLIYYFICLYILAAVFCPTGIKFSGITIEDCILAILLIIYLFIVFSNKNERKRFRMHLSDFFHNTIGILMTIVSILMIISVTYSLEKKLAISETIRFITYAAMYFIVKYNIEDDKLLSNIRNMFVGSALVLSLFGIIQYFTGIGLDKGFYEQFSFGARARVAATFGNPNSYAGFLILVIFPVIFMGLESKEKKKRFLYLGIGLFLVVNLILTFSRNAWGAFALGLVILIIYYNWKLIFGFILIGISALFIPVIGNRIKDFTDMNQNISRFHHWQTALFMIKDHPILGVGNGNYVSYYDSYIAKYPYLDYANQKRFPAHNSYLKVTSELGIVGIIPFVLLVVISVGTLRKALKYMSDAVTKSFYNGFLISAFVFLFMNFLDNLFFVPKVTVWFWLMLAIADGFIFRNIKQ